MATPTLGRYGAYVLAPRYYELFPSGRVQVLEDLGYGTVWIAGTHPATLKSLNRSWLRPSPSPPDRDSQRLGGACRQGRRVLPSGGAAAPRPVPARCRHRAPGGNPRRLPDAVPGVVRVRRPVTTTRCSPDQIILAALRKKVLRLSADRTAGALPYFTTVEHTKKARETLGQGPVLAVVQSFVAGKDQAAACSIVREWALNPYLKLQNYVNNLKETGLPGPAVRGRSERRVARGARPCWRHQRHRRKDR